MGAVTLRMVAQRARVSYGTASMALRGTGGVAQRTIEHVRKVAQEMGYRPNAAAAALASQKPRATRAELGRMQIACMFERTETPLHRAFTRACEERGYQLVTVKLKRGEGPAQLSRRLWNEGVRAIVLREGDLGWSEEEWLQFDWSHFAVVKQDRILPSLRFHVVRISVFEEFSLVLRTVVRRGYERILVFLQQGYSKDDDDVRLGLVLTVRERELPAGTTIEYRVLSRESKSLGTTELNHLRAYAPDVVLVFPPYLAFQLYEAGYRFPRDFALASQKTIAAWGTFPCISGCAPQGQERLQAMVDSAHRLIATGQRGIPTQADETVLPAQWVEGASLPDRS